MLKTVLDEELVTEVKAIDTSAFVFKTQYNTDSLGSENKIDDTDKKIIYISGLVTKQFIMLRSLRFAQNYLVFVCSYLKKIFNSGHISTWKSKAGLRKVI